MPFRVLLAAPSPLYAPIYFAWSEAPPALQKHIRISFADELSPAGGLVQDTLTRYTARERVLLAVGDLTRLDQYVNLSQGMYEPVITGGLVDRMCLWLLDGGKQHRSIQYPLLTPPITSDSVNNYVVLSHPRYMTTYHAAAHHIQGLTKEGSIDRIVLPVMPPGEESKYYNAWKWRLRDKNIRVAYINADITHNLKYRAYGHNILHDYSKDRKYSNLSMTGLFTSRKMYREQRGLIDEFQGRIEAAIRLLSSDRDEIAWTLYRNTELLQQLGVLADYKHLSALTESLREVGGYARGLALSCKQLERALDIRMPDDKAASQKLAETLFGFTAGDMPKPSGRSDRPPAPKQFGPEPGTKRWWYEQLVVTRGDLAAEKTPRLFERGHRWSDWPSRLGYFGLTWANASLTWGTPFRGMDGEFASELQKWTSSGLAFLCVAWIAGTDGRQFVLTFPRIPFFASGLMATAILWNIAIVLYAHNADDGGPGLFGNFLVEIVVLWACAAMGSFVDLPRRFGELGEQVRRFLERHKSINVYLGRRWWLW